MRCSMCEQATATVMEGWPAPVCAPCDRWLNDLHGELTLLEIEDPAIGEAARKVDEALAGLASPEEET